MMIMKNFKNFKSLWKAYWNKLKGLRIHVATIPTYAPIYDFENHIMMHMYVHGIACDIIVADELNGVSAPIFITDAELLPQLGLRMPVHNNKVLVLLRNNFRRQLQLPMFREMNISDLLDIMLAHETGHLVDPEIAHSLEIRKRFFTECQLATSYEEVKPMLDTIHEIIINDELRAWELGREYVPAHLRTQYESFNQINIESYKKQHEKQHIEMQMRFAPVVAKRVSMDEVPEEIRALAQKNK
jgi:hypothetical protein